MTFLKICGMQPGDDLSFTSEPVVKHIGIVFAEGSRRYVSPDKAREITRGMDPNCAALGVFVNSTAGEVMDTCRTAALQGAQLHGNEPVAMCRQLRKRGYLVWKAFSVNRREGSGQLVRILKEYVADVDGFLLDAPAPAKRPKDVTGGFGIQFDWTQLPALLDPLITRKEFPPVWIAGGINPSNVGQLAKIWHPFGVDVSSGVEHEGRKSTDRIQDLIEAVRRLE